MSGTEVSAVYENGAKYLQRRPSDDSVGVNVAVGVDDLWTRFQNDDGGGSVGSPDSEHHNGKANDEAVAVSVAAATTTVDDIPDTPWEKAMKLFHSGRQLQCKHLPRDVTEEEVREMVTRAGFGVRSLQLGGATTTPAGTGGATPVTANVGGTVGGGAGTARVTLEAPEQLEELDPQSPHWYVVVRKTGSSPGGTPLTMQHKVSVNASPTEMLLCVGHLPPSIVRDDRHLQEILSRHGPVRRCFLMPSKKTGESKGYAFVEYATKEAALHAKNALDGLHLPSLPGVDDEEGESGRIITCDWLDSSHVTLESLSSRCLYVDRLPPAYRDMADFRRVFSVAVNPPYCQIGLRNGCPQDWGLVEFTKASDAEETWRRLNGHRLRGRKIRISFCAPGVRAINLYLRILSDDGLAASKGANRPALLPDPPAPAIFQQMHNLSKQNPVFAQNLQNIIASHIQNLQSNGVPAPPPTTQASVSRASAGASSPEVPVSVATASVSPVPSTTASLLNGHQFVPPPPPPLPPPAFKLTAPPAAAASQQQNAALLLLLAQIQQQQQTAAAQQLVVPPFTSPLALASNSVANAAALLGFAGKQSPPTPPPLSALGLGMPPPPTSLGLAGPVLPFAPTDQVALWASLLASQQQHPLLENILLQQQQQQQQPPQMGLLQQSGQSAPDLDWAAAAAAMASPQGPATPNKPWSFNNAPPMQRSQHQFLSPAVTNGVNPRQLFNTPQGQKRKNPHVLPSPEPSPEGSYIGQHSQGLGGHYADSYFKRKKKM